MSQTVTITGDQLTIALRALGVNFIMGGEGNGEGLQRQPVRLITALAESHESRLRLSLIPLFLEHHEFAVYVRAAAKHLNPAARITLQCYYSAAVWLSRKHQGTTPSLPDHFSSELALHPTENPDENLRALAKRHEEMNGARVNWLGTYLHAAKIWRKGKFDLNPDILAHLQELKNRLG